MDREHSETEEKHSIGGNIYLKYFNRFEKQKILSIGK